MCCMMENLSMGLMVGRSMVKILVLTVGKSSHR